MARHRAANLASTAFEYRETLKEYLAVVEGHVNINSWAIANSQEEEMGNTELDLKRKHKGTATQREIEIRENNTQLYYQAMLNALKDNEVQGEQRKLLEELSSRQQNEYSRNAKLRKKLRKAVRFGPHLRSLLDAGSNCIIKEVSSLDKNQLEAPIATSPCFCAPWLRRASTNRCPGGFSLKRIRRSKYGGYAWIVL